MTETGGEPRWALGDLESALIDLGGEAAILRHLASSSDEIDHEALLAIATHIARAQCRLGSLWKTAFDQQIAERTAAQAELKAALATREVPGSEADRRGTESLRRLLRFAALAVIKDVPETGTKPLSRKTTRPR